MFQIRIKLIIKIFLLYTIIIKYVETNAIPRLEEYESLTNDQGLYNASDNVVVLHTRNFIGKIFNKQNAWAVQFYNSWCGHCQRFAPIWKALAHSITGWRDIVNVAAIDCANDDNNPLCREYEIMYYPVVRYFSPNSKKGRFGIDITKGKDEETMRHNIIAQLQQEQQEGKGGIKWPNIVPYRSSEFQNIWKGIPATVKYKFFLFEKNDSYVGSEVILDLYNQTNIIIRRVISDNPLALMYKVTKFPTLIVFDRQDTQINLKINVPTRMGVIEIIKDFMKSKGLLINIGVINDHNITTNEQKNNRSLNSPIKSHDILYQADLELALRYSLEHEIPLNQIINDNKMDALKEYLRIVALYLPIKLGNSSYLSTIRDAIEDKTMIDGEEFRALIKSTEIKLAPVYTKKQQWINCKGSDPKYRGYPCGLWTLFHTLTVNYAIADEEDTPVDEPKKILTAMHGYIKNFFGCSDCTEHFLRMADENKLFDIETTDEAVLWLWRAHNQVNRRLAGDITEDPEYPKIQYPEKKHCPKCKSADNVWDDAEILNYLKKKYRLSEIKYNSQWSRDRINKNELLSGKNVTDQQKTGWDFTIFDISICVVLYIVSATILVLVCLQFVVKRSLKKKYNVQHFLRKV